MYCSLHSTAFTRSVSLSLIISISGDFFSIFNFLFEIWVNELDHTHIIQWYMHRYYIFYFVLLLLLLLLYSQIPGNCNHLIQKFIRISVFVYSFFLFLFLLFFIPFERVNRCASIIHCTNTYNVMLRETSIKHFFNDQYIVLWAERWSVVSGLRTLWMLAGIVMCATIRAHHMYWLHRASKANSIWAFIR